MINNKKKCTKCGATCSKDQFFKTGRTKSGKIKYRGDCKKCAMEDTAKWRDKNKTHYNNYAMAWRAKNPEKQHAIEIKRHYGLSLEDYNAMLVKQNMKCDICFKQHDSSIKRGRLYVDHCHVTGKIRGLICIGCNRRVERKENINSYPEIIAYLEKHK